MKLNFKNAVGAPPATANISPKSPRDFRPWETLSDLYGVVAGVYLYHQAAREIADAEGWSDAKLEALLEKMARAINDESLPVRDRKLGMVVKPSMQGLPGGLVTVCDVNDWLKRERVSYQWMRVAAEFRPAAAKGAGKPDAIVAENEIRLPPGTTHVAFGDLAVLLTDAQWPDTKPDPTDLGKALLLIEHETELMAAARNGSLPLKKASTFGPLEIFTKRAIESACMTVPDFQSYAKLRFIEVTVEAPLTAFITSARPLCVDPRLRAMNPDSFVRFRHNIGTSSGNGVCKASQYISQIEATIKQQGEGYFTVEEAAQILADSRPGIDVGEMIQRMKSAVVQVGKQKERRLVRNPGDRLPILNDTDFREYASLVKISDVDIWLEVEGVDYRFPLGNVAPTSNELSEVMPLQRSKAQEEAILSKLQSNGHDPARLVKNTPGKPGVKSEIRRALGSGGMWTGQTVFNKAWERLASNGQLAYK
jgi:hypothetical protein